MDLRVTALERDVAEARSRPRAPRARSTAGAEESTPRALPVVGCEGGRTGGLTRAAADVEDPVARLDVAGLPEHDVEPLQPESIARRVLRMTRVHRPVCSGSPGQLTRRAPGPQTRTPPGSPLSGLRTLRRRALGAARSRYPKERGDDESPEVRDEPRDRGGLRRLHPRGPGAGLGCRAARREHAPLRIVHVARTFLDGYVIADRPSDLTAQLGGQVLADGVERLRAMDPDLEVTTQLEPQDSVAAVLTEASTHARLLVVGSRGRGGFAGLLLGSVSVPSLPTRTAPSSSSGQTRAAGSSPADRSWWAWTAPRRARAPSTTPSTRRRGWGLPLVAVHAWELPSLFGPVPPWTPEEVEEIRMAEKVCCPRASRDTWSGIPT